MFQFAPDLVLVSAGFDAVRGDELGEYEVTPSCFAKMTEMLCTLAKGRVVMALEVRHLEKRFLEEFIFDCFLYSKREATI